MIMDQYKEQYRKETEQIHAPAELIARTKAAMREEEARIRREFALQGAGTESRGISAVAGPAMVLAGGRNYGKGFNVRKWAYPLTAAAALFILVSVSLMMRGLKSGDMAMDMGASETSGGMMAAGAAMDFEGTAEMAAAPAAEMEDMSESASAVENAASETAEFSESVQETAVEKAELEEARKNEGQRKFSDTEKNMAEDTVPAESGAQSGGVAETESITIERVVKKPDFCGRPDTGKHVFEGQTFQVAEEGSGWMAYAETGDGGKYVIRGEAEDLETFLEMGYQKLLEQ